MSYEVIEHKVRSLRSWKRPIYTGHRTYRNVWEVKRRIKWLRNEYGYENIAIMPTRDSQTTTTVYVRVA